MSPVRPAPAATIAITPPPEGTTAITGPPPEGTTGPTGSPPAAHDPARGPNVWFARRPGADGGMELTAVVSDGHPNRSVVDSDTVDGGLRLYESSYRADGEMTRAVIDAGIVPVAPALWFVERTEADADPPATNLIAFASPEFPDGTIVGREQWDRLGADLREQVAALRWWTRTGQVHQIYVSPHWRRKGIGTKIAMVGAASTVGRRWPSLWGTGELTDLGDAWIRRTLWDTRVAPRSRHLPPMTPPGEAVGVPDTKLRPDDA